MCHDNKKNMFVNFMAQLDAKLPEQPIYDVAFFSSLHNVLFLQYVLRFSS